MINKKIIKLKGNKKGVGVGWEVLLRGKNEN